MNLKQFPTSLLGYLENQEKLKNTVFPHSMLGAVDSNNSHPMKLIDHVERLPVFCFVL